MNKNLINLIGWGGALCTLTAYLLVSYEIFSPHDFKYQILNLAGALGLGILCFSRKAYQPLIVNIIWGLIAVSVLTKLILANI